MMDEPAKVAPYFRLDEKEATKILSQIQQNVSKWEQLVINLGIPRNEMELVKNAFTY